MQGSWDLKGVVWRSALSRTHLTPVNPGTGISYSMPLSGFEEGEDGWCQAISFCFRVIFHTFMQTVGGSEQCPYDSRLTKIICLIQGKDIDFYRKIIQKASQCAETWTLDMGIFSKLLKLLPLAVLSMSKTELKHLHLPSLSMLRSRQVAGPSL